MALFHLYIQLLVRTDQRVRGQRESEKRKPKDRNEHQKSNNSKESKSRFISSFYTKSFQNMQRKHMYNINLEKWNYRACFENRSSLLPHNTKERWDSLEEVMVSSNTSLYLTGPVCCVVEMPIKITKNNVVQRCTRAKKKLGACVHEVPLLL